MRHYEVTLIVHPDQSSQVTTMIEKYKDVIKSLELYKEDIWLNGTLQNPRPILPIKQPWR